MVNHCSVLGCSNRSGRDNVSFFSFPYPRNRFGEKLRKDISIRRNKWLMRIKRPGLYTRNLKNLRVCSDHFHSGKPAALYDIHNPDWLPCLKLGDGSSKPKRNSRENESCCPIPLTKEMQDYEDEANYISIQPDCSQRSAEYQTKPIGCLDADYYHVEIKREPMPVEEDDDDETEPLPFAGVYVKAEYSDNEQDQPLSGENWNTDDGQEKGFAKDPELPWNSSSNMVICPVGRQPYQEGGRETEKIHGLKSEQGES